MSRRKLPVLENETARTILNELQLYGTDHQFQPVQNAFRLYLTERHFDYKTMQWESPKYPDIDRWTYDYWFKRLVDEGYIALDPNTRAVRCVNLTLVVTSEIDID